MASAWGSSFGSAWGDSWGSIAVPSGGWPIDGGSEYARRAPRVRTAEEIRAERVRFGVLPAQIIEEVAARQAADSRLDDQQRIEELRGELALRGLEMQSAHLEALNDRREAILLEEIARRLRGQMDERDTLALLLLAASV